MKHTFFVQFLSFLIVCCAVPATLRAQETDTVLVLDSRHQLWNAAPYTGIRPESSGPLRDPAAFTPSDFAPSPADSDVVWLDKSAPGYWLKLRVRSQEAGRQYVLDTNWPSYWDWIGFKFFSISLLLQEDNNTLPKKYQIVRNGRLAEGFNPTTPFALAFRLPKGETATFYLRITGQDLPLPLQIKTADRYIQSLRSQELVFSMYCGIILSLIIFALAMAITLRESRFLWFVAYVLTEFLLFAISSGFVFLYCGQTNLALWNSIYFLLLGLIGVTTGLLATKFLDLKKNAPGWHTAVVLYMLLSFLLAVGCIWVDKQFFYTFCLFFVCILALGPYIALAACVAISRRTGERHGFFLAAWSAWCIGGTVELLCYAGFIAYSQLIYHTLTLSSAAAGLLLMLALSERVNALRRANEIARATNTAKNAFIAKVSHEIRTPMNAIIGLTELILDSPLTPEQRDQLTTVRQCGQHLLDVVNDVLDISKAEANKLRLEQQHFDLDNLLRTTLKGLSVLASAKKLELHWQKAGDVPRYVRGDPQRLRQILVNRVGNAIKFSDKGRVDVGVERLPCAENKRLHLRFSVRDTGIGIPPGQLSAIFEDYAQAHQRSRTEGAGLGLAICKELVKLMGGTLQASSQLHKGSVFTFTIVLEPGSKEELHQNQATPPMLQGAPGIKVLIADDNLINVKVAVAHLSRLGYATAAVADGQEALEALAAANFDIVLMDLEMPKISGVEAVRRIRSGQGNVRNPEIPVIVLTAYSLTDAEEQCRGIEVNDFMLKPVSFHELAAHINKLIYPSETSAHASGTSNAPRPQEPQYPVLDSETARLRLALGKDAYQSIFVLSLEELRDLQRTLQRQHAEGGLSDAVSTVHTIKSTAATIGAVALQHAALDLEQTLRLGRQRSPEAALARLHNALNALFELHGAPAGQPEAE